jgi:hypothetical protein
MKNPMQVQPRELSLLLPVVAQQQSGRANDSLICLTSRNVMVDQVALNFDWLNVSSTFVEGE